MQCGVLKGVLLQIIAATTHKYIPFLPSRRLSRKVNMLFLERGSKIPSKKFMANMGGPVFVGDHLHITNDHDYRRSIMWVFHLVSSLFAAVESWHSLCHFCMEPIETLEP